MQEPCRTSKFICNFQLPMCENDLKSECKQCSQITFLQQAFRPLEGFGQIFFNALFKHPPPDEGKE